jgi:hypothetical protein
MKKLTFIFFIFFIFDVYGFNQSTFVLGVNQDKGELYLPRQVEEGPKGNIYVHDGKDAFIKIYSPSGKYISRMVGRGQGPGEALDFAAFGFFNNEMLLFTEYIWGHKWITFMELSGKFNKVLKIDLRGKSGLRRAKRIAGNKLIVEIEGAPIPEKIKGKNYYGEYYFNKIVIINREGIIEKEIVKKINLFAIKSGEKGAFKRVPFYPEFTWDLTKDNKIILCDGCSNILQLYSITGNLVKEIKTSLPDAPEVKHEDLKKWRRDFKEDVVKKFGIGDFKIYFRAIEDYKESVHKKKPVYKKISVTPTDNILVRGEKEEGKESRTYWLLNQKGKILVKIESKSRLIKISKNFIFYILEDDEGEFVYCLKREGNEKDGLLSLSKVKINES